MFQKSSRDVTLFEFFRGMKKRKINPQRWSAGEGKGGGGGQLFYEDLIKTGNHTCDFSCNQDTGIVSGKAICLKPLF